MKHISQRWNKLIVNSKGSKIYVVPLLGPWLIYEFIMLALWGNGYRLVRSLKGCIVFTTVVWFASCVLFFLLIGGWMYLLIWNRLLGVFVLVMLAFGVMACTAFFFVAIERFNVWQCLEMPSEAIGLLEPLRSWDSCNVTAFEYQMTFEESIIEFRFNQNSRQSVYLVRAIEGNALDSVVQGELPPNAFRVRLARFGRNDALKELGSIVNLECVSGNHAVISLG